MPILLQTGVKVSFMRIVMLFLSMLLGASVCAQGPSSQRREPGLAPIAPEQRRAELRSALSSPPGSQGLRAGDQQAGPQGESKRQLSEEERADLRRQLRQQAAPPVKPDPSDSRGTPLCNRGPAEKNTRSPNENCY
jgi:hypothetical protein